MCGSRADALEDRRGGCRVRQGGRTAGGRRRAEGGEDWRGETTGKLDESEREGTTERRAAGGRWWRDALRETLRESKRLCVCEWIQPWEKDQVDVQKVRHAGLKQIQLV